MSDFRVRGFCVFLVLICFVSLPGCSGKSPIQITLSATPPSGSAVTCGTNNGNTTCSLTVNQNQSVSIAATVANDKTNSGVSWSLGSSVGTLSSQTTTSVTYVAPAAISANTTATVTAASVANSAVTATVTITIDAVFQFESASLPVATVGLPYNGVISTEGASGPFTWTIISGSLPPGLTMASSDSASVNITGTPTTAGTSTVTIQATDSTGSPISKTFTITVNPPPGLTIQTTSLPNGTVGVQYPSATVNGYQLVAQYGTPPYTWTLINGTSLPPGFSTPLNTDGLITGTPSQAGTYSFTVQVQDSATPNPAIASKSLTVTVGQVLVPAELNGNYAFMVNGFDPGGKRWVAAGSFTANGSGGINNGTIDTNDGGGFQNIPGQIGTYSIDATGLGTVNLGQYSFYLSFVPRTNNAAITSGNLMEFDGASKQASGVLLQQTTTTFSPSASTYYAFGLLGTYGASTTERYALAGSFIGSAICTPDQEHCILDSDDAVNGVQTNVNFSVPAFGSSDTTTGRGTFAFTIGANTYNYAYYVVSSSELLVVEHDAFAAVAGNIMAQTTGLGASSLSDAVFETTALNSGAALSQLGVITTDNTSVLNTSFDQNTGGSTQNFTGSYTVDPTTGRTPFTGSGLQTGANPVVVYLFQPNQGFVVGSDSAVSFGILAQQQLAGSPTSIPLTLNGTYAGGSIAPSISGAINQVDAITASSNLALTDTFDTSVGGSLLQNQTSSIDYLAPSTNGRGVMPQTPPPTSIFYVVSSTLVGTTAQTANQYWTLSVNPAGNSGGMIEMLQQ